MKEMFTKQRIMNEQKEDAGSAIWMSNLLSLAKKPMSLFFDLYWENLGNPVNKLKIKHFIKLNV